MDPTTYNVHCANRMTVITKCHEGLVQRKFKLKVLVYDAELSDKIKDIEEIDLRWHLLSPNSSKELCGVTA